MADCETEINETEAAISMLEQQMSTAEGASDMTLYDRHRKLMDQLDKAMQAWEAAGLELEEEQKRG